MIHLHLHQAQAITAGIVIGESVAFKGISTDSRKNCNGRLFVALKGEKFNGEEYCQQAIENGAVAVLVSKKLDVLVPQLICTDSLKGLSALAKNWAAQCKAKIIAITGSNGKTTVKNMVYSILSMTHQCSATKGNLNNEIGVPLSLCEINESDDFAVIEMGAAKLGDISWLISLVDAHTAAITNVSPAHIGRFGSLKNIEHEKAQIISRLTEYDCAVLPYDNTNYGLWEKSTNSQVYSFGQSSKARVSIENIRPINLPVAGMHNQINAACAMAIAQSCGISQGDIKRGLESFDPEAGRLQNLGKVKGTIVINDSYNANPQSVKAAIDVLAECQQQPCALVFADMAELGSQSPTLHEQVGYYAKQKQIAHLYTLGRDSKKASMAFGTKENHFNSKDKLTEALLAHWSDFGTVLFKGSRSMKLETLINDLISSEKAA